MADVKSHTEQDRRAKVDPMEETPSGAKPIRRDDTARARMTPARTLAGRWRQADADRHE